MRDIRKGAQLVFLLLLSGMTMGTILQQKGAIERTQTDPVGYDERHQEESQGKKGPVSPVIKLFPRERFLMDPPVTDPEETVPEKEVQPDWDFWFTEEPQTEEASEDSLWSDWFKGAEQKDDIYEAPEEEATNGWEEPLAGDLGPKGS